MKQFGSSFVTGVCFKEHLKKGGTRWSGGSRTLEEW